MTKQLVSARGRVRLAMPSNKKEKAMKGKRGPRPQKKDRKSKANGEAPTEIDETKPATAVKKGGMPPRVYQCEECDFKGTLEELTEHQTATKHAGWEDAEPEQTELFAETGIIHRTDRVPLAEGYLNEIRRHICDYYIGIEAIRVQKKRADDKFNGEIKEVEALMDPLVKLLQDPFDEQPVDCQWQIDTDNPTERILLRMDNRAILDRKPLTAEERSILESHTLEIPY